MTCETCGAPARVEHRRPDGSQFWCWKCSPFAFFPANGWNGPPDDDNRPAFVTVVEHTTFIDEAARG